MDGLNSGMPVWSSSKFQSYTETSHCSFGIKYFSRSLRQGIVGHDFSSDRQMLDLHGSYGSCFGSCDSSNFFLHFSASSGRSQAV